MRRPMRPSRPTRSERRRERSEPSVRPESFRGSGTRRPSAVTTTATWRRFRPSNRPKAVSRTWPGGPGRFAQSTRRPVIVQPRADEVAELLLGPRWAGRWVRPRRFASVRRNRRLNRRSRMPPLASSRRT